MHPRNRRLSSSSYRRTGSDGQSEREGWGTASAGLEHLVTAVAVAAVGAVLAVVEIFTVGDGVAVVVVRQHKVIAASIAHTSCVASYCGYSGARPGGLENLQTSHERKMRTGAVRKGVVVPLAV